MNGEAEFRAFAVRCTPRLFRTAVLLTGDRHLAEDLVQDTLARMYRAWPAVSELASEPKSTATRSPRAERSEAGSASRIDNPDAYAQTVLTRQFLSHRRRRSSTERPTATIADRAADGADADLRLTLLDALAQLPRGDRAVLVLRYLADRSVDQVAADLGRKPATVKVQAMRALGKLRELLGDELLETTKGS